MRAGAGRSLAIAVTGATGPVARLLVDRLTADPRVDSLLLLDADEVALRGLADPERGTRRGRGRSRLRTSATDSCDPALADVLAGVDVVVHLDPDPVRQQLPGPRPDPPPARGRPDPGPAAGVPESVPDDLELMGPAPAGRTVRAVQTVLTAAGAAGVTAVVVVTTAMVYGRDVEVPVDEDALPAADPMSSLMRDVLEVERVAAAAQRTHPGVSVAVVRPAALAGPGVDTLVTRHFEAPRLLTVRGTAMRWQFCHLDDLVGALAFVALAPAWGAPMAGPVTVGSTGWLAQEEVERLSGLARVELPESLAFGTAERLHRLGLTPAPAGELRYVTRPWVVPSTRLRDAGWRPEWDNADAFEAVLQETRGRTALAGRRIGRRETATLGAAGATVAVLGTAAIVRRVRRTRRSR